jgi:hypothetical protein
VKTADRNESILRIFAYGTLKKGRDTVDFASGQAGKACPRGTSIMVDGIGRERAGNPHLEDSPDG